MTAGREEGLPPGQQAAAAAPRLYDEGVPETGYLRVRAGDYEVVLSAAKAWTIYEIHYAGELLAGATGHYGTVLTPKGGNWIGTGHSEGGREIVHSLRLTVDGRDCAVEPGATVEGRRIELTKSSTIHKFAATHTITVTDAETIEHAVLRATEDHDLKKLYFFMHCWPKETDAWIAQPLEGDVVQGGFANDGGQQVRANTRWTAQHLPGRDLGLLCYTPHTLVTPTSMSFIWDHERYHKYYTQHNDGASFKQGDELDYTMVVKVVPGETGDWTATRAAAADLESRYPPTP